MKVVLGENGREAEICQRSMEVDAADKLKANRSALSAICSPPRSCAAHAVLATSSI
jgi:hypothetical protein